MATIVPTIVAGLQSAGSAIASGASAAGSAIGSAATGTSGTLISGGLTALSAAGSIAAGEQREQMLEEQADMERLKAEAEDVRSIQEQNRLNAQLLDTLAAQNAAFAASGIDISSGTPVSARREARRRAERQLSTARANQRMNRLSRAQRERSLLLGADSASRQGVMQAAGQFGGFVLDEARRAEQRSAFQNQLGGESFTMGRPASRGISGRS